MTYWQPRIPWKFTNLAASEQFEFPLADYEYEIDQDLPTPSARMTGAHGSLDLLGDGSAPKGDRIVRVSFAAYDEDPEQVDAIVDEAMQKLHSFGRGWLYMKSAVSGVDTYVRARARLVDKLPGIRWEAGQVTSMSMTCVFRVDPFWHAVTALAPASATAAGTLTLGAQPTIGDTMTIGGTTYTFTSEVDADAAGEIGIGANLAGAKANILDALTGDDGWNEPNTDVSATAWVGDDLVVTATTAGHIGNGIVFENTFTDDTDNLMDGEGWLGGTTAGAGGPYSAVRGGFTINNPGSAAIYDAVITLVGTVDGPVIRNTTTGYQVEMNRHDTATYVFDAGVPSITRNGANDYASYVRAAGQNHLMRLDPGDNVFSITGVTAGYITIAAYAAYD